jgi:hypothetical protein
MQNMSDDRAEYTQAFASSSNKTSRHHVPLCLPELLLLAVAVVIWSLVKEIHESPHHVSGRRRHP